MKRLLATLLLVFGLTCSALAQVPTLNTTFTLSATSSQSGPTTPGYVNLTGTGVSTVAFTWSTRGTVSAGACALQGGSDGVTFGTTVIAAQTVTSSGGPTTITDGVTSNFLRIRCTTAIVGSGTVQFRLLGWQAAPSGTGGATAANQLDMITLLMSIDAAVNSTDPVATLNYASASGGTTGCNILSAATNNATSCGTAASGFYGFDIFSTVTTVYYLKLYNTVGAPTCSSATGFIRSIPIPPAGVAGQVAGIVISLPVPQTASFSTGLGYCITAGSAATNNDSAVTGIFGEIRYKQ